MKMRWDYISFMGLAAILFSSNGYAQNWETIDDPQALKALFSDTVIEAILENGVKTVARYNRDGTGELEAWGDTFHRTWEVRGNDQVCFGISDDTTYYKIERNMDTQHRYRAKNLLTGEIFEMKVEGNTIKQAQDLSSQDSGGAAQPSAEEIAAELANPNTPLSSLNLQIQYRTFEGNLPNAGDQDSTTLLFRPSFPFTRENGDVVFFRPAIPIYTDQAVFNTSKLDFDSESGRGKISLALLPSYCPDDGGLQCKRNTGQGYSTHQWCASPNKQTGHCRSFGPGRPRILDQGTFGQIE